MRLEFDDPAVPYESASQSARVWTETWVTRNLYCPNCGEPKLTKFENNRPAADFHCASCAEQYELKSQKTAFGKRVVDGAYSTMQKRLSSNENPSLALMNYDREALAVRSLFVVPKHFFTNDIIEARKPLSPLAQRAGWIGCNILIGKIPDSGRVFLVRDGQLTPKQEVLRQWQRTLFLLEQRIDARSWLIEVMNCVETINRPNFTLKEMYHFIPHLQASFPNNRHVREKVRQQLQVLRDSGYLEFVGRGSYRLSA